MYRVKLFILSLLDLKSWSEIKPDSPCGDVKRISSLVRTMNIHKLDKDTAFPYALEKRIRQLVDEHKVYCENPAGASEVRRTLSMGSTTSANNSTTTFRILESDVSVHLCDYVASMNRCMDKQHYGESFFHVFCMPFLPDSRTGPRVS